MTNINLQNYKIEHTPTESEKGGSLIYISSDLNYKVRNDLKLYKSKELESIFIEIMNKKGKNTIIGCVYKHPKLPIEEFNHQYLAPTLEKISFENKEVYLMGDFNINHLNYETHHATADFINDLYSNSFVPYITLPTRITPRSKTLIDNIFLNEINETITSGNLITDISDHHAQFLITPKILENGPCKKTYKRCFKRFNNELFQNDLMNTDWEATLNTNLNDVDFSFGQFFLRINGLLDIHAPFKYFKMKHKKHEKPWVTGALANSIKKKNILYGKFCRSKDPKRQEELHKLYKVYKNHTTNLLRRSKESHFKNLLEENKRNSYKIWQIVKELINIKSQSKCVPNCLKIEDSLITWLF